MGKLLAFDLLYGPALTAAARHPCSCSSSSARHLRHPPPANDDTPPSVRSCRRTATPPPPSRVLGCHFSPSRYFAVQLMTASMVVHVTNLIPGSDNQRFCQNCQKIAKIKKRKGCHYPASVHVRRCPPTHSSQGSLAPTPAAPAAPAPPRSSFPFVAHAPAPAPGPEPALPSVASRGGGGGGTRSAR
jgi:hypothetical protein